MPVTATVRRATALVSGVALVAVVFAGCGGSTVLVSENSKVISGIPWTVPETAKYRILKDSDVVGTGELSIQAQGSSLLLKQSFQATQQKVTDDISAVVAQGTLKPESVTRVIHGPEGDRNWQAIYSGNSVTVEQHAKSEKRTDNVSLPSQAYDSWADLFLWRTIPFAEGFRAVYSGVLSCTLVKPALIQVRVSVQKLEPVQVPAGKFEAWPLKIESGGETTTAWYADDGRHTLVRYDNGQNVFELQSVQ